MSQGRILPRASGLGFTPGCLSPRLVLCCYNGTEKGAAVMCQTPQGVIALIVITLRHFLRSHSQRLRSELIILMPR
jgi:hypothetical protein